MINAKWLSEWVYVCVFNLSKPFQPGTKNNEPSQQEACSTFPERTDTPARFFITALTHTQTYTVIKRTDQTHGCVRDVRRNRQHWRAPRALIRLRALSRVLLQWRRQREGNRAEEASGGLFGCFAVLYSITCGCRCQMWLETFLIVKLRISNCFLLSNESYVSIKATCYSRPTHFIKFVKFTTKVNFLLQASYDGFPCSFKIRILYKIW